MLIREGRRYLDGEALAAWYGVSRATVAWWRHTGYGPLGVRCGRHVRYPIENVIAFDEQLRAQAEAER
ncbi:helix-turn-helix transcriptional regulator [Planobispora rosea]|nr:hypothetical protein [Planobispora rosea]